MKNSILVALVLSFSLKAFAQATPDAGPLPAPAVSSDDGWHSGPTLPIVEYRLAQPMGGGGAVTALAAGAGYQLEHSWFPTSIDGKDFDWLSVGLALFISGSSAQGMPIVDGSIALEVGILNLVQLGFGIDLLQDFGGTTTGVFVGNVGKQNLFFLLAVHFDIAGGPYSPPVGIEQGAKGLPRGGELDF